MFILRLTYLLLSSTNFSKMVAVGYKLGFEENDEELNLGDSGARGNTAPDSRGEYVRSMVNDPRGSLGANGLGGSRWATTDSNIGVESR